MEKIKSIDSDLSVYFFALILLIFLLILRIINIAHNEDSNIKAFQIGKKLVCVDSGRFLILKSNGWEYDGQYFIKDDRVIKTNNCENK